MEKPPHPGDLMDSIRRLAAEGAYDFDNHAIKRMEERGTWHGLDLEDVLKIMALGDIQQDTIRPGKKRGEWKCLVVGFLPWTSREAGVVTVVVRRRRLIFVTVEWIDP